jgi:hypothetical protein
MPLSLGDQFRTAEMVNQFGRLIAQDRIRTDYLGRVEQPIPHEDMDTFSDLTGNMDQLLAQAHADAESLLYLIEKYPEELEKSYGRIFWADALTGEQKMRLDAAVERHPGPAEYGIISARAVFVGALTEREMLEAEMRAIRRGDIAAGDLSSNFLCNLAGACIVGGLFAPPPMNIVGVSIGVLTIGHVYAIGDEC